MCLFTTEIITISPLHITLDWKNYKLVTILHFLHVVLTAHVYENDTFLTGKRVIFLRIYRKLTGSLFVFTAALDPPLTSKVNWIFFSKQCWHISYNAIYITFCFLDPDYNTARFNFQWRVRVIFQKSSLHRRLVIKLYNILSILEISFTYRACIYKPINAQYMPACYVHMRV